MIIKGNKIIWHKGRTETIIGWFDSHNPLTQETIDFSRELIEECKTKIEEYSKLAEQSTGSKKGAYRSNLVKEQKNLERHKANLEYQLEFVGKDRFRN